MMFQRLVLVPIYRGYFNISNYVKQEKLDLGFSSPFIEDTSILKENRELKKKLADREQTTSERKILVVLAILQIISTILEIIEKILNHLK